MNAKKLIYSTFALAVIAQLFVPCLMISSKADIALTGKEFRFKVVNNHAGTSINGNYLWFRFVEDKYKVANKKEWERSQAVYVRFDTDTLGFARIQSVSKHQPADSFDWVKARAFLNFKDSTALQLLYPFNNYYVENANLKEIEEMASNKLNDSTRVISLKVRIRENQFIVRDLMVDGVSFKDFVKQIWK